jgi:hypothetical protein
MARAVHLVPDGPPWLFFDLEGSPTKQRGGRELWKARPAWNIEGGPGVSEEIEVFVVFTESLADIGEGC